MKSEPSVQIPPPLWTETFGNTICVYSRYLGLTPVETALFMANTLCNLSGGFAALADGMTHYRIGGFSIVLVGAADHRYQRLLDMLMGPVKSIQAYLRECALRLSRSVVDGHAFGPVNGLAGLRDLPRDDAYDQFLRTWDASVQAVKHGPAVPPQWEERDFGMYFGNIGELETALLSRIPGVHHRPTILHLTNDLNRLDQIWDEVFDRRLLVVDTAGGFFRGTFSKGSAVGNRALLHLATLLAGKDVEVGKLHPEQGYGTLQQAQVRVLTSSRESDIADMLSMEADSARPSLLQEMLLVSPSWKPIQVLEDPAWFAQGQKVYREALLEVINHRIWLSGPVQKWARNDMARIWATEGQFINSLQEDAPDLGEYTRVLAQMVPQLAWAFSLLKKEEEAFCCVKAAGIVAHHAATVHLKQLRACFQVAKSAQIHRLESRIVRNLANKGPSTRRDIQRSLFGCKQGELAGALDGLLSNGTLAFDGQSQRFAIDVQGRGKTSGHQPAS